jgi:hypothetical protein
MVASWEKAKAQCDLEHFFDQYFITSLLNIFICFNKTEGFEFVWSWLKVVN